MTNPAAQEALPPIDEDDTGEFSAEFVKPIAYDPDDWDVDHWAGMA